MGAALLFAVVVALPLGVIAAAFHRKPPDFLARFIALFGQSVAAPWLGVMLIFLFRGSTCAGAVVGRQPAAEHHPARDRRRRLLGCRSNQVAALEPAGSHGQ